jgi:hypothetical protein
MKILAFGHRKRVGKDTACKFATTELRVTHGLRNVQKKGFADKVKAQCYELFAWAGLQPGHYYEEKENEAKRDQILPAIGMTPRALWIGHGMAVRQYSPDAWIDYVLKGTQCDFLLISDLRFPNEAAKIQELGGYVVKIENPRIPHTSDPADDPLLNWDGWNHIIHNDDNMCVFMERVAAFIEEIM